MPDTNEEFGTSLERLAEYIYDLQYDDIPSEVLNRERAHILDTLGCILYGSTTPWVQKVIGTFDRLDETGTVSVLGTDAGVPPARAALVNGTASHSMDYDDHAQEAGIHAGSATVPTALAVAESLDRPIDGQEFLTAVTAGVEVGIRSGFGIGYGSVSRGWHIAGWTGAFAAATTVGKLFELPKDQLAHALAVAGTQGSGLLGAQYGAEVKRFHMGKAAEAGYVAAGLAREGFTGDTKIFQDRYGAIGRTMSDDYNIEEITAGLGSRYRIMDKLSLKPFPSVGQIHAPVDAIRGILEGEQIEPQEVENVVIYSTPTVKDHVGWEYEPTDVMSAQANIQYAVATLLVDGEVTIDAYTEEAIRRPEVLDRIEDISVVADDSLEATTFGSVVEVTTDDGTYENAVDTPRGYPEKFLSTDEIRAKFRNQAMKAVPEEDVDVLIDIISDIKSIDDIRIMVEHC